MPEARCLCGDHVWRVDAPLQFLHHCHCGMCRKHQGSAYSTVGAVAPEHLVRLREGAAIAYQSPGSPLSRFSCERCGSPVPPGVSQIGLVWVIAGSLEGEPGSSIEGHIFVGSKAPWFAIEDDAPQHERYPPGIDAPAFETPCSSDLPGQGVRGSCLCGDVRFRITGEPIVARHCHCLRCRRARGALHASNLVVPVDGLRVEHGADRVRTYRVPEARFFAQSFCGDCGGPVPRVDEGRGIAVVPMGSLDDDPGVRPSEHIFVGSKSTWHEIADDLPQYDEGPPG